jgi:hypothetical protein
MGTLRSKSKATNADNEGTLVDDGFVTVERFELSAPHHFESRRNGGPRRQ